MERAVARELLPGTYAAFRRALRRTTGHDPRGMAFHGFPHLVPHLREVA